MAGKDLKGWEINLRQGEQDSLIMELYGEINKTEELHLA